MAKFDSQTRVFPDYNESFEVYDSYTGTYVEPVGTYSLSSNVIFRISQQSGGPQDTSDNSHTVSYYEDSSPTDITVSSGGPYSVTGDTVATLSGRNQIRVNDASDLSFGDGATNSPFTFSIWVKCDWSAGSGGASFPANTLLFKENEYWIFRYLGGGSQQIHVRIYNSSVSSAIWSPSLADNEWINLTFTYDGQTDPDSLNLYVNGVPVDRDSSVAGSGAMTAGIHDLSVGSYGNNSYGDFVGEISDIFLFDKELKTPDVLTLYNARFGAISTLYQSGFLNNPPRTILQVRDNATGSYPTVSRIGDPGRTGRYNTNFNDTNSVVFNSNVTTSYPSDLQLADAAYISQSIATPNTNATIEATGIVRKGVADANITFTPGEDLTPFVEDNLFASTPEAFTDPFYLTGSTVANVGLGFTAPLRSKTKIEIDLNPTETTSFGEGFTPAGPGDAVQDRRQKHMVYFNHVTKKWDEVGIGVPYVSPSAGSDVYKKPYDALSQDIMNFPIVVDGMIGFGGGKGQWSLPITSSQLENAAYPITTCGFPLHPKFLADSDRTLAMSQFIDKPFVAEKFVLEYSASFNFDNDLAVIGDSDFSWATSSYSLGVHKRAAGPINTVSPVQPSLAGIYTFFMLNQRGDSPLKQDYSIQAEQPSPGASFGNFLTCSLPQTVSLSSSSIGGFEAYTNVSSSRDLVTWGQQLVYNFDKARIAGAFSSLGTSEEAVFNSVKRELNTKIPIAKAANAYFPYSRVTRPEAYVMSGTFKSVSKTNPVGSIITYVGAPFNNPMTIKNTYNETGTRTGVELQPSGRELVAAIGAATPSGTILIQKGDPAGNEFISVPAQKFTNTYSPYVIMPTDKFVFGWQHPMATNQIRFPNSGSCKMSLIPGKGKLTIYGSLITDAHEHHDGLNQPLTSEAVHEFIGFHGPPLDQFDTEPRQQFSGSMLSNVVTGSISEDKKVVGEKSDGAWFGGQYNGNGLAPLLSPNYNGAATVPGSFARFISLQGVSEIYYDSIAPQVLDVFIANGGTPFVNTSGYSILLSGDTNSQTSVNGWWQLFPFEPRFSDINRGFNVAFPDYGGSNFFGVFDSFPGDTSTPSARDVILSLPDGRGIITYATPQFKSAAAQQDAFTRFCYGIGDRNHPTAATSIVTNAPSFWTAGTVDGDAIYAFGHIRGFKYGLYHAVQQYSSAKFRHNKYGQFRDMLEQRLDTRFYSEKAGRSTVSSSPVQVRFVASDGTSESPSKTSSSNLSQFATSSLPYFDGVARNRTPIVTADLGLTIVSI